MSCLPIATQAEAEAGTANDKLMTPLRTKEAIDALGVSQAALASATGGEMVGFEQEAGAQPRTAASKAKDFVNVLDYIPVAEHAAILARTSTYNATANVQAAINAVNRPDGGRLFVSGVLFLGSSVNINRDISAATGDLYIVGASKGSGFRCTAAIAMFSSSTLHSTDPVTGNVYFEGLTFSCDDADTDAFVVSEKYCRVVFSRCRYEQIRSNESSIFMQSWRWVNCAVWRWKGAFSKTVKEAYDCHANLVRFEGASVGGDAWSWSSIQGCSVMQGLHEGSFGSHITADGTNGLMVGGNYTENYSNPSPHYQFANPGVGGVAKGVAFAGNHVNVLTEGTSDLSYYPVRLGDCSGSGTGNTSNANLYDDTNVTPGNFTSSGDKAAVSLHKGTLPLAGLPTGVRTLSTGIVAHAGGGQGSATLLTAQTNIISTVASADDSVILPAFSGPFSMDLRVRNSGANTVKVFPPVGYNFAGLGTNAPDSLTGGGTDRTYFYIGAGVWTA